MPIEVRNFSRNRGAGGKFVLLLRRSGEGLLLFSDFTQDSQHRDIVSRWERASGKTAAAEGFSVAGGGWWKFDAPGELHLYGRSAAYGAFDPALLKRALCPGSVFDERTIRYH